jgi:TPM domain
VNRRCPLASILLILGACATLLVYIQKHQAGAGRHVFVNEAGDHRFDESIQTSILAAWTRTHVQNAVVISDRFAAGEMADAAAKIFQSLDLGRGSGGRAILYLFSPRHHALKIEVGYALEGALPDAQVRLYEAAAKTFTYADRYQDFWAELINTLNIEIQDKERPGAEAGARGYDFSRFRFLSGGAGVLSHAYQATPEQLESELKRLPPSAQSDYAPGSEPRATLDRYLASLANGLGEESLPLLSAESRIFRSFTPLSSFQLYRNYHMMSRAGLDRIIPSGRLAFAFFHPGHPVLPVALQKGADGLWRVNEPLSWALFHRFEDSQKIFLKFPLAGISAELAAYLQEKIGKPLYHARPLDLNVLPGPQDPAAFFYFHYFWLERAEAEFAKIPDLATKESQLWLALDTSLNLGRMSDFLTRMAQLTQLRPGDKELERDLTFYRKELQFDGSGWVKELP